MEFCKVTWNRYLSFKHETYRFKKDLENILCIWGIFYINKVVLLSYLFYIWILYLMILQIALSSIVNWPERGGPRSSFALQLFIMPLLSIFLHLPCTPHLHTWVWSYLILFTSWLVFLCWKYLVIHQSL